MANVVFVGGRNRAPVVQAEPSGDRGRQVDRQQVHRVHQKHPHEDREGQRREEAAVEVKDFLDRGVDELEDDLDECLPLARDADGGLRVVDQNRPMVTSPSSTDMNIVSTWKVQNPSPTVRWVRWWVMYSVLFAGPALSRRP